jgi:hypothetical protein
MLLVVTGGVEQLPHRRGERQERGEVVPGLLPDPGGLGVLLPPGRAGEGGEGVEGGLGGRRGVDLAQLGGDGGGVPPGDGPQAVADEVLVMPTSA